MAITFNLELNDKPNKQGLFTIFIRITENRKKRRVKTQVALKKRTDWNKEKQCVRASDPDAKLLNKELEKALKRAKAIYSELEDAGTATSDNIVRKIQRNQDNATLLAYSKKVHNSLYSEGRLGTWKKYGSFVLKLEAFLTDKRGIVRDVTFKEVSPSFVEDFTAYLKTLANYRDESTKLHPNTISKMLRIFRAIVNRAIKIEGYLKPEENPFTNIKISDTKTIKEKLSAQEIEAIEALELEENSLIWHARNAFLLSYYCAGIRAGDMIQLRWANISPEGRLIYQMGKNHKPKDVLLVVQAKDILARYQKEGLKASDYIFPYLSSTAKYSKYVTLAEKDVMPVALKKKMFDTINAREVQVNKQLRKIAELAGISKHLSFHVSRHSFAKTAKLAGTDNALLEGLMNHSTLAVTERYMKDFDTCEEDKALLQIFQPSNERKEEALLKALKDLDKETLESLIEKVTSNS